MRKIRAEQTALEEISELRKKVADIERSKAPCTEGNAILKVGDASPELGGAAEVVWTMNLDLRFTYFSSSVYAVLGYDADEALAQTLLGMLTTASYDIFLRKLAEKLAEERTNAGHAESWAVDLEFFRKERFTIWTETNMGFIRDSDGKAIGIAGITRNIEYLRLFQRRHRQTMALAFLGRMTDTIALELNNPLGSILLYSELLSKQDVPHEIKKDLMVIHNEAKRVARAITDLLNFSLPGGDELQRSNLHRIVNKVLAMRRHAHIVSNIHVSSNLHETAPFVNCSPQLQQAIMEVILSLEASLKSQNGGNIIVTTGMQGNWVRLLISSDTSCVGDAKISVVNINDCDISHDVLFCRYVIASHGGIFNVERNQMGATFIIELPIA